MRLVNLFWAVLADTLADLDGIVEEIRAEAGRTRAVHRPSSKLRADRGRDERRRHSPARREPLEAHERPS